MSRRLCNFVDMFCQQGSCPRFCRISEVNGSLTGNADDPCFLIICNLGITAATGSIKQGVINTSGKVLVYTEHNTFAVHTDFVSYIVDADPLRF